MKKGINDGASKYERILLIDDNEIDNFINERIITSTNFADTVLVKDSAIAALDYLKSIENKEDLLPNIIFLDLNMPLMDGFGFLEEFDKLVKGGFDLKNKCKVIVLSSSISPSDIDKASTNQYIYKYLNKPLSERYLAAIQF